MSKVLVLFPLAGKWFTLFAKADYVDVGGHEVGVVLGGGAGAGDDHQ